MKFEYDPAKSAANKAKHGLDFEEAKALWKDENLLEVPVHAPGSRAFLSLAALGARSGPGLSRYYRGKRRAHHFRTAPCKDEVEHYGS